MLTTTSYGTWTSPITAEMIAEGSSSILNMQIHDNATYWCEFRPTNKGRYTIVKRDFSGKTQDATDPEFNVRTFVHEYGAGAFTASKGIIYASNAKDSAIYIIKPGHTPHKLTEGQTTVKLGDKLTWKGARFTDLRVTSAGLIAIGECHEPGQLVENFLALINTSKGTYQKIASGYDFFASPAVSPDGKKIAWLCWNLPNMPWTKSELWIGDLSSAGTVENAHHIISDAYESVLEPQWSADGTLYFISDRYKGWWNLHAYSNDIIENICPMEAEIGGPFWIFDQSAYALLNNKIFFAFNKNGEKKLAVVDLKTKQLELIQHDGIAYQHIRSGPNFIQCVAGYSQKEEEIIQIEDSPGYPISIITSKPMKVDEGYISPAQHIAFPSNERTAYGYYYPPKNKDYKIPTNEKPPLVVMIHGGPTAQARGSFQLKQQFWTSRGFAVLDVNYGGSTGYGRAYRDLLNHNWGIVDVEDCENGALSLVRKGFVDPNKLVIRGGSAGGYTTLAALAFKKTFKAGADYFGVADITALANDTHKFESTYMNELIGLYPEEKDLWESRSPINSVHKISSPLIIFQGENDPIVPKNQSIMIYEALKKKGIKTELHLYPDEEHGFRKVENLVHSLNREAEFYLEVFNR